jgi:hypothetical protein
MLNEADEFLDEDIQASADYYDNLLNDTLPQKQAERIALEQFGVVLEDNLLNRIMEQYASSILSLEDCVASRLRLAGLL